MEGRCSVNTAKHLLVDGERLNPGPIRKPKLVVRAGTAWCWWGMGSSSALPPVCWATLSKLSMHSAPQRPHLWVRWSPVRSPWHVLGHMQMGSCLPRPSVSRWTGGASGWSRLAVGGWVVPVLSVPLVGAVSPEDRDSPWELGLAPTAVA